MQRIEEKHIDNSQLVPSRIAEQKTTFRQTKPIAPDLSGVVRSLQSAANLVNNIADFQNELNREMDELASIKVNTLFDTQKTIAMQGLDNKNPNDELYQTLPTLKQAFYDNVQKGLQDIPMSKRMKQIVMANLNAKTEELNIQLNSQFQRKQVEYINNETMNLLNSNMQTGNTENALKFYDTLVGRGVKMSITREQVKENCTFNVLKEAISLNDFSVIKELENTNKDGKYANFKELSVENRLNLIKFGKGRQINVEADNYNKFLVSFVQGSPMYNQEQIETLYKNGELSDTQYLNMSKVRAEYDKSLQNIEKNKIKAKQEEKKVLADYYLGKFRLSKISLNPAENALERQQARQEIIDNFPDIMQQQKLLLEVDKIFADGLEGRGVFKTQEGKLVDSWFQTAFREKSGATTNLEYDPWGWSDNEYSQEFQKERFYELYEFAAQLIQSGYSAGEVIEKVQEKKKQFAEKDVKTIMTNIQNRKNENIKKAKGAK